MEGKNPHILIIEDDEDTRFVYSVLLQIEGYLTTPVGTVAEGFSRILSTDYDLILMDVRLSDGDGVDLCQKIRTFNKKTPIMFVSAAAYEKDIERGMKSGAQAYMTKPADADQLLQNVKYLLGKKGLELAHRNSSMLPRIIADAVVAAALIDKNRLYKAVSPAYAEAGGYCASDLVGRQATDIFPDVSGEAGRMLDVVRSSRQPYFISRYPYTPPNQPERGLTYWDAAFWPIDGDEAESDVLIVVRQKEKSGDIAAT